MEFAITLHEVTRLFGSRRGVEGINLAVAPGELVGLVGPAEDRRPTRAEIAAAAAALPGCRWSVPLGRRVRVALDPAARPEPPAGYHLVDVPADLEDLFTWLKEAAETEATAR